MSDISDIPVTRLSFCSIFSYCPKSVTEEGYNAKKVMRAIKNDLPVRHRIFGELFASELIAKFLKTNPWKSLLYYEYFTGTNILIPVPRSSPICKGALWPSFRIARAMEQNSLGKVRAVIERIIPVSKSSLTPPERRPSPYNHYESMAVLSRLSMSPQTEVILVDDIITRGHTFMGAAWCIKKAFPEVQIKAFAAMRTVSNESEFKGLIDPVYGQIVYRNRSADCLRRP